MVAWIKLRLFVQRIHEIMLMSNPGRANTYSDKEMFKYLYIRYYTVANIVVSPQLCSKHSKCNLLSKIRIESSYVYLIKYISFKYQMCFFLYLECQTKKTIFKVSVCTVYPFDYY